MIQLEHRKLRRLVKADVAYLLLAHIAHISGTILASRRRGEKAECARYNCYVGEGSHAYGALNFQWLYYFYHWERCTRLLRGCRRGGICWLMRVTGYLRGRYLPRNFRFEYIVSELLKLSALTGFYVDNKIATRN